MVQERVLMRSQFDVLLPSQLSSTICAHYDGRLTALAESCQLLAKETISDPGSSLPAVRI